MRFFFNWVEKGLSEASFQRSPKFNYFFSLIWVHSLESSNIILDQAPLQLIHQHETHSFITLYGSRASTKVSVVEHGWNSEGS